MGPVIVAAGKIASDVEAVLDRANKEYVGKQTWVEVSEGSSPRRALIERVTWADGSDFPGNHRGTHLVVWIPDEDPGNEVDLKALPGTRVYMPWGIGG